jgi:hypothetical protein
VPKPLGFITREEFVLWPDHYEFLNILQKQPGGVREKQERGIIFDPPLVCVPSMFDSLGVKVPFTT